MDQICYSREGIVAVAGLLTALSLACMTLFGVLVKSQADQIADLRSRLDRTLKIAESQAEILKRRKP